MTRTIDEILGKDSIANLQRPIETAKGLPASAYTGQDFFDLEQERLFPRTWVGVGFADDIANPGDAIPVTVTGLPLIIVRDKKGVVRAFHNVCRHRATIILEKPEKGLSNLSCPYHAWAWDLEGNLRVTPYFDGTPNSSTFSVDKKENGLVPVRCGVFGGVVFVNLEGNALPIEEYTAPINKTFGEYDFDAMKIGHRVTWEYDANWKLVPENWEVYHHIWVHGGIFEKMSDELDVKTGELYTQMLAEDNTLTLTATKNRPPRAGRDMKLPSLPGRNGNKEPKGGGTCVVLPSTTMTLSGKAYAPVIYTPIAPGRTRATMAFLFAPEAAEGKEFEEGREKVCDLFLGKTRKLETGRESAPSAGIRSQDLSCMQLQQQARHSPAADASVQFSPTWETNVYYFQNWVANTVA